MDSGSYTDKDVPDALFASGATFLPASFVGSSNKLATATVKDVQRES